MFFDLCFLLSLKAKITRTCECKEFSWVQRCVLEAVINLRAVYCFGSFAFSAGAAEQLHYRLINLLWQMWQQNMCLHIQQNIADNFEFFAFTQLECVDTCSVLLYFWVSSPFSGEKYLVPQSSSFFFFRKAKWSSVKGLNFLILGSQVLNKMSVWLLFIVLCPNAGHMFGQSCCTPWRESNTVRTLSERTQGERSLYPNCRYSSQRF